MEAAKTRLRGGFAKDGYGFLLGQRRHMPPLALLSLLQTRSGWRLHALAQ